MHLTRRQYQIVRMVANGMQGKEIADKLDISLETVKRHLTNAREATESRTTAQLAVRVELARRANQSVLR